MMSLTLYLCRMNTFSWPNALYILSASPRDREYSLTSHKMLVKWAIRLPNQFLSHNTLLQSKNQAKVAYFTKLMILIFGCPEEIRITNFTRMPLLKWTVFLLLLWHCHICLESWKLLFNYFTNGNIESTLSDMERVTPASKKMTNKETGASNHGPRNRLDLKQRPACNQFLT